MGPRLRKNAILSLLLFIGGLYFISQMDFNTADFQDLTRHNKGVQLTFQGENEISEESWMEQGDYLPFHVSYQILAGTPSNQKKFLAVGLSSVQRKKGSYVIPTLQSLFSQSSPAERSDMVVAVLLADFSAAWRNDTVRELRAAFPSELRSGQLLVVHVSQEWYPPLTGLKRNFNDAPERVTFRSKQNLDYSFLIHFCASLSRYYLQIEDDVSASRNFLSKIRTHIAEQEVNKVNWVMLEFSSLGYIGKLYKSIHLPLLSRFLFLFYQEMPCDWLMPLFRTVMTQKEPIHLKPSLFQHIGTFSSFGGTYNHLKDKDFDEGFYNNPPAQVYSDMSTYKGHVPKLAWEAGGGFFWAQSPRQGNHLTVVFSGPALLTGIVVETGSGGKDILQSGQVEIGQDTIRTDQGQASCKEFQSVGNLVNGRFERNDLERTHSSASSCLRILVTNGQEEWVVISKVRVSVK